jgi:hypothetical protein
MTPTSGNPQLKIAIPLVPLIHGNFKTGYLIVQKIVRQSSVTFALNSKINAKYGKINKLQITGFNEKR